jgi:polysaccharide biosynthesis transport protein
VAGYQAKLESIPVREQEVTHLARDYEMSKAHYSQLLDKQLSAETATQLEVLQKGEKFKVLDPAQPPQRPSKPNRPLLNAIGALAGLTLGIVLALATEFLGPSITYAEQITDATALPVLEVIPEINTEIDSKRGRARKRWAAASGLAAVLIAGAILVFRYSGRLF